MSKKLTIGFVKSEFEKEGYKLLTEEYKNAHSKLKYICPLRHKHNIKWNDWQQGHRCGRCGGTAKLTIKFIKKEFKKEGYKLLTKKYTSNKQKLNYICSRGHKHSMRWNDWHRGVRCPYCSMKVKKDIKFVAKQFEKEGYKLLYNEYKNKDTKLEYVCSNNHIHTISWHNWRSGHRCPHCANINNSGENNPNWKGGISCEPYCYEWSFKEFKEYIKERDNNRCLNPDCWGNINRLSIHHIDYDKKNCGQENLITLCASCNSRANKDREWHKAWYSVILQRRYNYQETTNAQ